MSRITGTSRSARGLRRWTACSAGGLFRAAPCSWAVSPGIGKSTLLLQMAGAVAASGKLVLYASGEESLPQIKDRANRLGMLHDNLLALSTSRVEDVLPLLEGDGAPDLLIVDSVQTFTSESAEGLPAT